MRAPLLAGLLVLSAASAGAEIADPRLKDPEAFARFTDVSRTRTDSAVAVPGEAAAPARRRKVLLDATVPEAVPAVRSVPDPDRSARYAYKPAPLPNRTPKLLLSSGGLILLALALGTWLDRPRVNARGAVVKLPRQTPLPPLAEAATEPAPRSWLPPQTPPPTRLEPAIEVREPWWALNNAEMEAVYRWDSSPDKELGLAGLSAWLNDHAMELKNIDVERLTAKLRREA